MAAAKIKRSLVSANISHAGHCRHLQARHRHRPVVIARRPGGYRGHWTDEHSQHGQKGERQTHVRTVGSRAVGGELSGNEVEQGHDGEVFARADDKVTRPSCAALN